MLKKIDKKKLIINFSLCFGIMFIQYSALFLYKIVNLKIFIWVLLSILVSCIIAGIFFGLLKFFLKSFWFDPLIYLFLNFFLPYLTIEYLDKMKIYPISEYPGELETALAVLLLIIFIWGLFTKIIYLSIYYIYKRIKKSHPHNKNKKNFGNPKNQIKTKETKK